FGDISTGAHNDLAKATDIARSMVKEYGMSDKVGQVYVATENQSRFLNLPGYQKTPEYSDATAQIIDGEVRDIITQQYETAKTILKAKKPLLKKCAELLLEKETVEGHTLKELMAQDQPAKPA
ncbi:MAG: cell division protein FtsH, partial [Deltaproteobacteria bacterium]